MGPPQPPAYYCTVSAGTPGGVIVPIKFSSDPRNQLASFGPENLYQNHTRSAGAMLQIDHDFGFATLTGQFSYRNSDTNATTGGLIGDPQDPRLITSSPTVLGIGDPGGIGGNIAHSSWLAQEVRLASPSNQAIVYTVGLYHFSESAPNNALLGNQTTYPNTGPDTLGQVEVASNPILPNAAYPNGQGYSLDIANTKATDDAYAVFGQTTYTPGFLPGLHLTGGLRYNFEHKTGAGFELLNGQINQQSVFDSSADFEKVTFKANAAYDITPSNMVYVDVSTGFKAGGFAYGQTPKYNPETITAYEIGSRNRFLDNRLQLNVSAFHYDYKDYLANIFLFYLDTNLGHPNAVIDVTNAPSATVDGQSLTASAYATTNDLLTFNITHLNTNFNKFDISGLQSFALSAGFLPGATAATFNYAGTPIPGAADVAFTGSYDHTFNLPRGTLDAEVDVNYTGTYLYTSAAKTDSNNETAA